MVIGIIAGIFLLLTLAASYYCYRIAFYSAPRQPRDPDFIDIPEGDIYEVFRSDMERWTRTVRSLPQEDVQIQSFDGLTLRGKFFEYAPGAPVEILLHGYRGNAERDMNGGVLRCRNLGRSALLIDHRASGASDGNVISFGVNEHRDCLQWVDFLIKKLGPDVKIILTGISMGAATAMICAGTNLPENVVGVLADCGFSSAREIMYKVIREMGLPPKPCFPFVKLGARLFGHFRLEEVSPIEAVKRAKVPIIFYHGESDDFVPCDMSRACYEACASKKMLVTIPGAGHGLCYPVDPKLYMDSLTEFSKNWL